jgi:hypothetical protein
LLVSFARSLAYRLAGHRFGFTLHRNDPVENGRVIVSIG